jgi:hypothetical protein
MLKLEEVQGQDLKVQYSLILKKSTYKIILN